MSEHITNGFDGDAEPSRVLAPGLLETVRQLGSIFGVLALICDLVQEVNDSPNGEEGEG